MGRGLSRLQRYILAEAGRRPRVYHAEVLVGFFGWRPRRPLVYDGGQLLSPVSPRFSRARIGERQYEQATDSVQRACRLLEDGGIVRRVKGARPAWVSLQITDKGREWLAANTRENLPGS
jgi:hypothetical protein